MNPAHVMPLYTHRDQQLSALYWKLREGGMCALCARGAALAAIEKKEGRDFAYDTCDKWRGDSDCAEALNRMRTERGQRS